MKIYLIVISLFTFLSLFVIGDNLTSIFSQISDNTQSKWAKYTNQTYGFSLEYPSFWIVKENSIKDQEIVDLEIGPLTKNILSEKFTGHIAFRSFGESEFGMMPIDDIGIITDIVKYMVKKIINDKYNLDTTILNNVEIHNLKNTTKEIGTFTYLVGDRKDTVITTIVTNYNNKTMAFFLLGTVSQFENPKFIQDLKHIIKSITFLDKNSKLEQTIVEDHKVTPIINILEDASVQGYPNYDPKELVVSKGTIMIRINNTDIMPHTLTNGRGPLDPESGLIFATNIIKGGDLFELKIDKINSGQYPYYCSIHPYMTGTLVIK